MSGPRTLSFSTAANSRILKNRTRSALHGDSNSQLNKASMRRAACLAWALLLCVNGGSAGDIEMTLTNEILVCYNGYDLSPDGICMQTFDVNPKPICDEGSLEEGLCYVTIPPLLRCSQVDAKLDTDGWCRKPSYAPYVYSCPANFSQSATKADECFTLVPDVVEPFCPSGALRNAMCFVDMDVPLRQLLVASRSNRAMDSSAAYLAKRGKKPQTTVPPILSARKQGPKAHPANLNRQLRSGESSTGSTPRQLQLTEHDEAELNALMHGLLEDLTTELSESVQGAADYDNEKPEVADFMLNSSIGVKESGKSDCSLCEQWRTADDGSREDANGNLGWGNLIFPPLTQSLNLLPGSAEDGQCPPGLQPDPRGKRCRGVKVLEARWRCAHNPSIEFATNPVEFVANPGLQPACPPIIRVAAKKLVCNDPGSHLNEKTLLCDYEDREAPVIECPAPFSTKIAVDLNYKFPGEQSNYLCQAKWPAPLDCPVGTTWVAEDSICRGIRMREPIVVRLEDHPQTTTVQPSTAGTSSIVPGSPGIVLVQRNSNFFPESSSDEAYNEGELPGLKNTARKAKAVGMSVSLNGNPSRPHAGIPLKLSELKQLQTAAPPNLLSN